MKEDGILYKIRLFFIRLWHNEAFCRCAARAILVFFTVYGSMMAFLSCFGINNYNVPFVGGFAVVIAVYLSAMFYNEKRKNLMYMLLLAFFLLAVFLFGRYTNSGFYAIVNIIYKRLEVELNLAGIIEYTERYTNRYLTITTSLVFIVFGMSVFINLIISNTMCFFDVFFATSLPLLLAVYFGYKPSPLYVWMLMTAYTAVYILNRSKKFRAKSIIRRHKEKKDAKKNRFYTEKNADGKMMFCVVGSSAVFTMLVLAITGTVFADYSFNTGEKWTEYKMIADDYAKTFITYGIWGFDNEYEAPGGVNGGELGGVSAVRPDYQTDLKVTYTPYSYEPVYLRSYIGCDYTGRSWRPVEEYENAEKPKFIGYDEAEALEKSYENGDELAAKGKMVIENIDAGGSVGYLPYYARNYEVQKSDTALYKAVVDYYPPNENAETADLEEPSKMYTYVGNKNKTAIYEACKGAGITVNDDIYTIKRKLLAYFQQNYPYTMRPGKTPKTEDFVNYFLTKQKKGLCAHYASASTLIYRSLGIPARYVEGYVFSYGDVQKGTLEKNENYDDWYDGYSLMGKTGVVTVEINDVHAHAWTEVFDSKLGWVPIDVTPSSIGAEVEDDKDFWEVFNKWMDNNTNADTEDEEQANDNGITTESLYGFAFTVIVVIAVLLILFSYKKIIEFYKLRRSFATNNKSQNILNRYKYVCNLIRKTHSYFDACESHIAQLEYMSDTFNSVTDEKESFADVLEKISYSKHCDIDEQMYEKLKKYLIETERKIRKVSIRKVSKNKTK